MEETVAFAKRDSRGRRREFFVTDFNAGGLQKILRVLVDAIGHTIDESNDAGVDQRLRAVNAGKVRHVTGRAARRYTVQRGLDDGVHLGVDGAYTVPFDH